MRLHTPVLLCTLALLVAQDVYGQRRGRLRGRTRPRPETTAPAPEPEKKKTKVEHWLAVTGGDVYLGTGQLLRRATVLVGDDKIHAVGHDLDIPEGAEVIDATGRTVSPGFVAVKARGMGAPRSADENAKDSVNPFDPSIKMGLAAGITSFLVNFEQGSSKPGGKSAVIKCAYGDIEGMVVAQNSTYSMRVPLTPAQWREIRDTVKKANEYIAAEKKHRAALEKDPKAKSTAPKKPKGSDELLAVLRGESRLWVSCQRGFTAGNIRQALDLAELFGQGVVLDNPTTAWTMADEVAAADSMAIINPRDRTAPDPARPESTGANIAACAILNEAGVPVAVTPPGGRFGGASLGTGGILGQDLHTLHIDAAFAVRGGMDNRKALRTITLDAAKIIGADSRVGSIEAGKDADLLILGGDPLHYRTFVELAIVNGKVVYQKDKEPFYSHVKTR